MKTLQPLIRLLADEETLRASADLQGASGLRALMLGHFRRFGLYNPLGLAAAGVFLWTLFSPWWYAHAYNGQHTIRDLPRGMDRGKPCRS